jgi:hypothetical protein
MFCPFDYAYAVQKDLRGCLDAACNCKRYHTTLEYKEDARCPFFDNIVASYQTFCMIICCSGWTLQCISAFQEHGGM